MFRTNFTFTTRFGLIAATALLLGGCGSQTAEQPAELPTAAPVAEMPTQPSAVVPTDVPAMDSGSVVLPEVDPSTVTGDIVSAGSSTVYPLAERIAEGFKDAGYTGNITIDSIGSGAGFERFCTAGETDVSNASRAIKDDEVAKCKAIKREPVEFRVGTDAIAVVVNPQNTWAKDVTIEELGKLFSTATMWSDVRADWPAEPIKRYSPGTDSGTFDYFVEVVFNKDKSPILAANPQMSEDDNVILQGVEGDKDAIGYFGYAYFAQNKGSLSILSLNGVEPTFDTAEDGSYKLSRPLFLYSTADIMKAKPQVASYINYFLTHVDEEISDVGYFPTKPDVLDASRNAWLAANGQ
ncbi:MAG: PstS family phosphate ABC transporter substrate-binding protein [Ardenticatenales bacterium]